MDLKHVEGNWKKAVALASAVIVGVVLLSGGTEAQVTPQTVELAKIDVQKLSAGYRASKVIGSSVVNDANEFIGKIDDLLVSVDGKEPYAVLSVGGFLGMGTHLVVVPYDTLKFAEKQVMSPGRHQGRAQIAARVQVRDAMILTGATEVVVRVAKVCTLTALIRQPFP